MAFEGMDADQADGLARQLGQYSEALTRISAMAGSLAAQLAVSWRGPASATFQHEWESRHQPALNATAHALSGMHDRLTANIREQRQASAAGVGGAGTGLSLGAGLVAGATALLGSPLAREIAGGYAKFESVDRFGPVLWAAEAGMKELGKDKYVTGRYTKNWDQVRGAWRELSGNPESKLMDYKSWQVIQWGHDALPGVAGKIEKIDKFAGPLTVLGVGVDAVVAADDAYHGNVLGTVDEGSKILKSFPDTYLLGVGVSLGDDIVKTAMHTDWHKGILPGLGSMAGQIASHDVLNILLP